MKVTLRSLRSLLLSVGVLLTGHGLQLTLLPLQGQALGWSPSAIGFTGSAYYLGFILGCLSIPPVISRVGHIRAFVVAVAVAAMALLAASVFQEYWLWLVFRLATGWSMAALYTTIESWLNERATNEQRGALLAFYTIISLGAMAVGPFLIELSGLSLDRLFPLGALLIIGAALPVAMTSMAQPVPPPKVRFRWSTVFRASQVGLICAGLSGMVMGLLWSLGAVYATNLTGSVEIGSRFIAAAIIGGLVFQFPVGRLSDRFDRRWMMIALAVVGVCGANLWLLVAMEGVWLLLAAFLCGAAAMPMYSVSIAHANDNAEGRFLEIASGMLMANAIGAMLGPMLYGAAVAMGLPQGFMNIITIAFVACLLWTALRLYTHPVGREHFEPYQPLPKTSPEVLVLDPRLNQDKEMDRSKGEADPC